jgi:biopolymer transport protein ExbD
MQSRISASPNVTPMIDIMLVLLSIFMVITPMIVNGTRAVPPVAVNLRAHPEQPGDHTLGIDRDGHYIFDREPVTDPDLAARVRAIYARSEDHVLFVRADRELDYARVLDAIDIVRQNGVRVVGMIAEPPVSPLSATNLHER